MTFSCGIRCAGFCCWFQRKLCRLGSGLAIHASCCFGWTVFNMLSLVWCRLRVCCWLCIAIAASFMFNFPWFSCFFDRFNDDDDDANNVDCTFIFAAPERFVNEWLLPLNTSTLLLLLCEFSFLFEPTISCYRHTIIIHQNVMWYMENAPDKKQLEKKLGEKRHKKKKKKTREKKHHEVSPSIAYVMYINWQIEFYLISSPLDTL